MCTIFFNERHIEDIISYQFNDSFFLADRHVLIFLFKVNIREPSTLEKFIPQGIRFCQILRCVRPITSILCSFFNKINRLRKMSYKRRQKDIERQDRRRRRDFKNNNIAKELRTSKYRQRIVKDKTKYTRKTESTMVLDE